MSECIFCKIVAKEIPATMVHEDEHTLAFMDIGQVNPGHVLVAVKKHAHPRGVRAAGSITSIWCRPTTPTEWN